LIASLGALGLIGCGVEDGMDDPCQGRWAISLTGRPPPKYSKQTKDKLVSSEVATAISTVVWTSSGGSSSTIWAGTVCERRTPGSVNMKKTTGRKLVLGQEVVKVLMTDWPDARLQDARGGWSTSPFMNSFRAGCSGQCHSIDK
jgi:hypothetical protein